MAEERRQIEREVHEIVEPVLTGPDLHGAIVSAFERGTLDMPFCTSRHAHDRVVCMRDRHGAIRFRDPGGLPLAPSTLRYSRERLPSIADGTPLVQRLVNDIGYFSSGAGVARLPQRQAGESDPDFLTRLAHACEIGQ